MGSGSSKDLHSRLLQSITEHAQDVNCLAVSEDLSVLVTGSEDCTARMWSIRPAETACLGIMKGHTKYITCITITETFVVTGSSDKTIRKWDMTTCECVYVYRGHTSRIYRLICTGEFIFSTSNDKTAKAWLLDESDLVEDSDECDKMEIAEEMCIRTFRGHTLAVYPIIYVPAADDWGKDEITINPLDVIITGSADSTAKIWSFEEGTCLRTLTGHLAGIMCMVTDASATTLYTGSADKTIRSWNIQRGECLK
ncbi:WD repeat-containing protein 86-like, partial [Hyalella azteca]|uniref:WD repeat-containing protein 86-like n=1 Tax=Hyalella azteca TaxID=294128 RepID=A0A8B7P174_HYAAZ